MIRLRKIPETVRSEEIKKSMLKVANVLIDIIIEKNKLYGDSLLMLDEKGLFLRVYDKIYRLKHLIWDKESIFEPTEKEKIAIANAVFDILGYMLLWIYFFIDKESINYLTREIF